MDSFDQPRIIRLVPHQPIVAWSVGPNSVQWMLVHRRRVADLVAALARFMGPGRPDGFCAFAV